MPAAPRQPPPELRPAVDEPGLLARVPWTLLAETGAGLGSVGLLCAALVRSALAPDGADAVVVTELAVALLLLVPLMLRHPVALARASRRARTEAERARHDHLTGLPNRLAADAALDALIARGATLAARARTGGSSKGVVRYWEGAAYLLIDLDNFKPVNDEAGHAAGDRLLVEIAGLLREACTEHDLPARVGGDEFAILADRCDASRARELAGRVRDALAAHVFAVDGKRYAVSGSIGLVRIAPGDVDADAIRGAADRGAYRAKEEGRNAVYELASVEAEPVLVERGEASPSPGDAPAGRAVPGASAVRVLARRAVGLEGADRVELMLDPAGTPPRPGAAATHVTMLGAAAALLLRDADVAVVMPPAVGETDLAALARAARRIAARGDRAAGATFLLEVPRRRGESDGMAAAVEAVRAAGLPVGVVCRAHTLTGLGELVPLALDELQLHLDRAPVGTLEAYAAIAAAGGRCALGVRDLESADEIGALARAGVRWVSGPATGPVGTPAEARASLGAPLVPPSGATGTGLGLETPRAA